MRQIAPIMGMTVTIDIDKAWELDTFEAAFERMREIDERFSNYKPHSEITRYNKGEISQAATTPEFKKVVKACQGWQKKTDGYFSHLYGDQLDTNGYVKGWAIAEAVNLIKKAGYGTFCVSAGGDMVAASDTDKIWKIGIQNPADKKSIIKTIEVKDAAVATSGNYERGQHIINPKTGKPANYWFSVTVTGPDIITADVLATACFAAGKNAQNIMANFPRYELFGLKA